MTYEHDYYDPLDDIYSDDITCEWYEYDDYDNYDEDDYYYYPY